MYTGRLNGGSPIIVLCYIVLCTNAIVVSLAVNEISLFSFEVDQCKDVCSDSFFLLPVSQDSQRICQRGCRFFNIIDMKEERTINETNNDCHLSCTESYTAANSKNACVIGCDAMSKKKKSDLRGFLPYLEQYNMDEQEFDSLEADIFLDPLIRKQVQIGYDLQYKIPEAYIRTMPIDSNEFNRIINEEVAYYKRYKNNFICSNIVPFMVFVLILLAFVICTLKLTQLIQTIKYRNMEKPEAFVEEHGIKSKEDLVSPSIECSDKQILL